MPLHAYAKLATWGETNALWIQTAVELGKQAVCRALNHAGLAPRDLGAFFFTSVTGISSPSIDGLLINRMGLSPNIRRIPMFGLGCVAGAAGISRAADYVKAHRSQLAVLLSVEGWIVGADGAHSRVRQWAGLDENVHHQQRFAFRRHYRVSPWTTCMELHWGSNCQLYITPVAPNEICVAAISRDPRLRLDAALALAGRLQLMPSLLPARSAMKGGRWGRKVRTTSAR